MSQLAYILGLSTIKPDLIRSETIDDSVIVRVGQDDIEAFEELYIKTEKQLYSFVLSMCKNHDDSLDIIHDTYMKIRASAHLYKPMGKPMAWIFTIARNLVMTNFKKINRISDYEDYNMEDTLDLSYISDPTDKLVLETALTILNEEDSQIILLHAVNGMKHREIAESLDLKLNTVISKYNRGLKQLKNYLEKEGYYERS